MVVGQGGEDPLGLLADCLGGELNVPLADLQRVVLAGIEDDDARSV